MKRLQPTLAGVACLILCLGWVTRAWPVDVEEGTLKSIVGDVEVKKRGEKDYVTANNGMKIGPGDVLSTGITGRAILNFKNSETKISPLTQFVIGRSMSEDTTMYTEFYLLCGKVSSHVIKTKYTGIRNRFNIITPTSVAGVRGTIETVEYQPSLGTRTDIRDGKGYAAPLPVDKMPRAVLELLGIAPPDTTAVDTEVKRELKEKEKSE